jgi:hypothetical protein
MWAYVNNQIEIWPGKSLIRKQIYARPYGPCARIHAMMRRTGSVYFALALFERRVHNGYSMKQGCRAKIFGDVVERDLKIALFFSRSMHDIFFCACYNIDQVKTQQNEQWYNAESQSWRCKKPYKRNRRNCSQ